MVDAGHLDSCFVTPATCENGFTASLWVDITDGPGACGHFGGLVSTIQDNPGADNVNSGSCSEGVSIYCRRWIGNSTAIG